MKIVKLHVIGGLDWTGRATRQTFVIREGIDGDVDIVEEGRPRCEADRSVPLDGELVLEVERADE